MRKLFVFLVAGAAIAVGAVGSAGASSSARACGGSLIGKSHFRGVIKYDIQLGTPIDDTNPLPASGCHLNHRDRSGIYADGSGYDACISDPQVQAETESVVNAHNLLVNFSHIYILFVPKHVETCF